MLIPKAPDSQGPLPIPPPSVVTIIVVTCKLHQAFALVPEMSNTRYVRQYYITSIHALKYEGVIILQWIAVDNTASLETKGFAVLHLHLDVS